MTREDGSVAIERAERAFAPGDRVMFLKNDRRLGVKNGSLGTVMAVTPDSMRAVLDGPQRREVPSILTTTALSNTATPRRFTRHRAPPLTATVLVVKARALSDPPCTRATVLKVK